jgi:hypothetical protein
MCQKETYLSMRAFQVSGLLNKIATIVGEKADLGEVVAATLEMSAVTNLKAFDTPTQKQVYSRQYFLERTTENNMAFADRMLQAVNEATGHLYQFKFNKNYLGFVEDGKISNFMSVMPRRKDVNLGFKVTRSDEYDKNVITRLGGRYMENSGWYVVSIKPQSVNVDEVIESMKPMIAQARNEYFA